MILRRLLAAICLGALACASAASARVIDDFETLAGWQAFPSQGVSGAITSVPGRDGRALALDFDLRGAHGHVIARKAVSLDLPANYQFLFDLQADAPVNNFEVKLIDEHDNVWWLKRLDVTFPRTWTTQHLRKRHITFAWGPAPQSALRRVTAIEFVVSAGSGGVGRVCIDNLRFEPVAAAAAARAEPRVTTSTGRAATSPRVSARGAVLEDWSVAGGRDEAWLELDFGYERELGGLVLDWAPGAAASAYEVQLADARGEWQTVGRVRQGNGGRDYLFLHEQQGHRLRLRLPAGTAPSAVRLARLEVKGPEFGASENAFFQAVAAAEPRGSYPRYYVPEQAYWTVVGSPVDDVEGLLNEHGAIEVAQMGYTIEPFLYLDGRLITWADVTSQVSLEKGYLPIPSVEWRSGDVTLTITALAAGQAGADSRLIASYRVTANGKPAKGQLFLAVRPFQVNPPWQSLFHPAGWTRLEHIRRTYGVIRVNERALVPLESPDAFGATPFEAGEITEHLRHGAVPAATEAEDPLGFASAALAYEFNLPAGGTREVHVVSPFHADAPLPRAPVPAAEAAAYVQQAHAATRRTWEGLLDRFQVTLPPAAQPVIDTLKSNLAYIFINQDGPRIQPGSRNYQRSWIRDGSLTSTALLELGLTDEVRAFADWYAPYQFPDGKVPCVVDARGADPTDEHDSHGQLIYLFMQVYQFSHDAAWLRQQWPHVVKTVGYIRSLRAKRMTPEYRDGPPEKRVLYGLVPESISHEGYSAKPMHSYWDDFFILRGLKDAVSIAEVLGEHAAASDFARERDAFARDLYASIDLAMTLKQIDFIPGCAELGDFDATSTTIALAPGYELGRLPEPALHRTFDRYFERFVQRRDGTLPWVDFTPYENRVIGSYVYLGQKDRAKAALDFFMAQRRPAAWNHWAEVVFREPRTPRMIGDMPHTWCGSDFIRSVRAMFVYEREQDQALVLAAGVPDEWVLDPVGVTVKRLPTYYGPLDYALRSESSAEGVVVRMIVGGDLKAPPGGVVIPAPLAGEIAAVSGDARLRVEGATELVLTKLPAAFTVRFSRPR
ncbi:discoidin domain-containing protein [Opitutus sp. ER46]|uniref:discoidin domain-containing protein n=1 Tax=Opitutus sp. ER46 TaxID=2161864 RepID=UPI000D2FF9D2|nr:discoidin domain-containing protein [Opitutus sp. ER46]PTX92271.1 hypothetical protein DB354_13045 [Opitutus sp. ER46]